MVSFMGTLAQGASDLGVKVTCLRGTVVRAQAWSWGPS